MSGKMILGVAAVLGLGGAAAWAFTRRPSPTASPTAAPTASPTAAPTAASTEERRTAPEGAPQPTAAQIEQQAKENEAARQKAAKELPAPASTSWIKPKPGRHYDWKDLTVTTTGLRNFPLPAMQTNLIRLTETVLDRLYDAYKKKAYIESAYRSPQVNKKVGGEDDSSHLTGLAVDLKVPGVKPVEVAALIKVMQLPYDQLIIYEHKGHLHVGLSDGAPRREALLGKRDGSYTPFALV